MSIIDIVIIIITTTIMTIIIIVIIIMSLRPAAEAARGLGRSRSSGGGYCCDCLLYSYCYYQYIMYDIYVCVYIYICICIIYDITFIDYEYFLCRGGRKWWDQKGLCWVTGGLYTGNHASGAMAGECLGVLKSHLCIKASRRMNKHGAGTTQAPRLDLRRRTTLPTTISRSRNSRHVPCVMCFCVSVDLSLCAHHLCVAMNAHCRL